MLDFSARKELGSARLAFVGVLRLPDCIAPRASLKSQPALTAPFWISAANTIFDYGNAAIAARG